jgi:hypothetical protein
LDFYSPIMTALWGQNRDSPPPADALQLAAAMARWGSCQYCHRELGDDHVYGRHFACLTKEQRRSLMSLEALAAVDAGRV